MVALKTLVKNLFGKVTLLSRSILARIGGIRFGRHNWYCLQFYNLTKSQMEMRYSRRKFQFVPRINFYLATANSLENNSSTDHIHYVMNHVLRLSPAREVYCFAHWGSCREILEYFNENCTHS